mmetsp:Transcript_20798/g.58585  ORF Transcript_20798/g.58585 Transcript_20798/m.58585 type:complete len:767 (-) Transcript_20798:140-2440(-)
MAGKLFDVFNKPRWSSVLEKCPEGMEGATILLKSSDGEAFDLPGEAACLSGFIRKSVDTHGPDVEIETLLPASSLGKLVEYMKFHKDTPPGEIEVPLVSENLVDSGVSKWDAAFINVDKELLFELLMAANCMDLPSLEVLAAAKAYLICKGKTADKLRKDAGMSADLPEEEETQLTEDYLWTRPYDIDREEAHLATLAVVMQGMVKAAEKNSLFHMSSEADEATAPSADMKSFRAWSWQAAIANDWKQLEKAPEEVKGNRDLVIDAIRQSRGAALYYASDDLKADRDVILAAVRYGSGEEFGQAAFQLRSDRSFVMEAIEVNGKALEGASDALRNNKQVVLEAAKMSRGSAMKGAAGALSSDRALVLECTTLDPQTFKHAAPALREDRDFAMEVLRHNGLALQYMSTNFKADRGLVAAALNNNSEALAFAHTAARADLGASAPWDPKALKPGDGPTNGPVLKGTYTGAKMVGLSLSQEARDQGMTYAHVNAQKSVQFSALSSMFANMGQGNYIAANMALDKYPFYERPQIDAVTVMWGAVGAIGMRWKAFASQDFLNATPDILMGVEDCCKVLHLLTTRMDTPEWTSASLNVSPEMLAPTAGMIGGHSPGGGFRPGESAAVAVEPRLGQRQQRPQDKESEETAKDDVPMEAGPLGGWPRLSVAAPELEESKYSGVELELVEGARVRLTGLQAKNGMTGIAQQHYADGKGGKWKVCLDGNGGSTQLRDCYLEVIAPPEPDWKQKADADAKAARVAKKASRPSTKSRA